MKLLAASFLALLLPSVAGAALEVKLSVSPKPVRKGAPTVVELRPYWTYKRSDGSCCLLRKANVSYPFKVEAVSPSGRVFRVRIHKTPSRYVWSGVFTFGAAAGRWIVRAPQWGPRYSRNFGARPRIVVYVRR
jgi:hypothetical protein